MQTTNENNSATFIHLSSLSQYIFPFGNIIVPFLIWNSKKENAEFIDFNGKQVLNFQLSILIYTIIVAIIAIPFILINIINLETIEVINFSNHWQFEEIPKSLVFALAGILGIISLKIAEFFLIIYASLKASNGEKFNYPITISFLK